LIISAASYVNNMALFSDSLEDCQQQVNMLTTFLQAYRQCLNPAKSTFAYWTLEGVPPPVPPMALMDGHQVPLPSIKPHTPFR
jgi:hypothetical protein